MLKHKNIVLVFILLVLCWIGLQYYLTVSVIYLIILYIVWLGLTLWGSFDIILGYFVDTLNYGLTTDKKLALTFDDGPHEYTPAVLDVLKKHNVKATFFCIGCQIQKYPDSWHYNHMLDPETMSPGSIMPPYEWLLENDLSTKYTSAKIKVLKTLNTPYPDGFEDEAVADLEEQALEVATRLRKDGIKQENLENKEIVALIAYLQRLGTDIKPKLSDQ